MAITHSENAEWDVPHWLKTRLWDFFTGIFVAVAVNLGTSEKSWSIPRICLLASSSFLALTLFGVASTLDKGERGWRQAMAQTFMDFIWDCRYTAELKRWLTLSVISFLLFAASTVWSALY